MSDVSATAIDASAEVLPFRDSYEASLAEIVAVPDDQLVVINVDIPSATTTVLGALPEIRPLRARLVEELPKFDVARFDKLEAFTRAAYHAHTLFMAASKPPEPIPELAEQCSNLIATFRKDAEVLAHRGLINGALLRNLRGTIGYRDIAFDLAMLTQVLRENWPKFEGKTALTAAELNQGEMLVTRLTLAIGHREQAPTVIGDAAINRHRAFTLFMRTYNDARRAIAYLMPDQADEVAPTVHVTRGPSKKKPEVENDTPEGPGTVAAPPNGQPPLVPPSTKVAADSPYTA